MENAQAQVVEKKDRSCAFCLVSMAEKDVKLCGGCKKRAYCSKECQTADWSPGTSSQVHKIWCKLDCGEEDVDWKVVPVPGKGLGVIAMRFIPAKSRIMVDATRADDHPGIQDLLPLNGTTKDKIRLNWLTGDKGEGINCLKIARANHDCCANADYCPDPTFNVAVLFARRDIEMGQEICIDYGYLFDVSNRSSEGFNRSILKMKWGIECSDDCRCRDTEIKNLVQKGRHLDAAIPRMAKNGKVAEALELVEKLLKVHETIGSSCEAVNRTLYEGFQVAILKKQSVAKGTEYIQKAYGISVTILSSKSQEVKKYENYVKDPSAHGNYLLFR